MAMHTILVNMTDNEIEYFQNFTEAEKRLKILEDSEKSCCIKPWPVEGVMFFYYGPGFRRRALRILPHKIS